MSRFYKDDGTLVGQLASQAHEYAYGQYSKRLETERADQVYFYDIFNHKFANLIIQECISACATDRLGKTAGVEELIKERFGIVDE